MIIDSVKTSRAVSIDCKQGEEEMKFECNRKLAEKDVVNQNFKMIALHQITTWNHMESNDNYTLIIPLRWKWDIVFSLVSGSVCMSPFSVKRRCSKTMYSSIMKLYMVLPYVLGMMPVVFEF